MLSFVFYRSSIKSITSDINNQLTQSHNQAGNLFLANLYYKRSQSLYILGAFHGTISDCQSALYCIQRECNPVLHYDCLLLAARCHLQMALGHLRLGVVADSLEGFECAFREAEGASHTLSQLSSDGSNNIALDAKKNLDGISSDAMKGMNDVSSLVKATNAIEYDVFPNNVSETTKMALHNLENALAIAPGAIELHLQKIRVFSLAGRWEDILDHCEKLAKESLALDGVFGSDGDLKRWDPLGRRRARLQTTKTKTTILRLPDDIIPYYLRALRLEERYEEAETAIQEWDSLPNHPSSNTTLSLVREKDKLRCILTWKERADALYRVKDYHLAAAKYAECMRIDGTVSERRQQYQQQRLPHDSSNRQSRCIYSTAGGRIHAVLHCNRAACLMAMKNYKEAVKECHSALAIQSGYMKGVLRLARCYFQLKEYEVAMELFRRWLDLARDCRVDDANRTTKMTTAKKTLRWFESEVSMTQEFRVKAELAKAETMLKNNRCCQLKKSRPSSGVYNEFQQQEQQPQQMDDNRSDEDLKENDSKTTTTTRSTSKTTTTSNNRYDNDTTTKRDGAKAENILSPQKKLCPNTKCHYEVLRLHSHCRHSEIKKAYHKMAIKYHPDKNKDPEACDIFRRIQVAYEVLSNNDSRVVYDAKVRLRGMRCY